MNARENSTAQRGKKILIIEDDELVASIYKRHFESACFEVQVEFNGTEGYYQISRAQPDAVLLDLLLPGMDGPSIIRKFRAQKRFAALPFIVFSNAFLGEAIGRDAVSAGATQVFNKATATPQEIVTAVVESLSRKIDAPIETEPELAAPGEDHALFSVLEEPGFHSNESMAPATGGRENPAAPKVSSPVVARQGLLDDENAFRTEAREEFYRKSAARIDDLREIVRLLKVDAGRSPREEVFLEMARLARGVSCGASLVGLDYLAHLAAGFEACARELAETPAHFGAPKRNAFAKAIDMMARLLVCGPACQVKEFSRFNVLVVDDDAIARTMVGRTLDRASLAHVATGRPEIALELLTENVFDLVILDVNMEGMSGFELCAALRKTDRNQHCPVIFVTVLRDFHSKMVSLQSGGKDFVVKPFDPMELALKAILYMIEAQLDWEVVANVIPREPARNSDIAPNLPPKR